MQWILERDLAAPGLRLFCLPHAGSGAVAFYGWRRLLPATLAVCPVLLPGREVRLRERAPTSADQSVNGLHAELREHLAEQPYAVFGHSMGSLLAYAWLVRIAAERLPGPVALIVSGRNAPDSPPAHHGLHLLPDADLVQQLRARYGETSAGLLDVPEMRSVFLPILRADLALVESFSMPERPVLSCTLTALAGVDDASVTDAGLQGWRRMTSGRFHCERLPGGHFYHLGAGRGALLALLGALSP